MLQGSVATYARCGGILNQFTTNVPKKPFGKKLWKSVEIRENYCCHEFGVSFLAHPVMIITRKGIENQGERWRLTGSIRRPSNYG